MNVVSNMAVFSSQRMVFGLPVCDLDWSDAFMFVSALADMPIGQTVVSFLNAHNCNLMLADREYRETLERHLVLPDGIGIDVASFALHGKSFPANLNGTDFIPGLLTYISRPKRIGLVGARPAVLAQARDRLAQHAPWHEFIAIRDGYFPEDQTAEVMQAVADAKLDILLVAMGTPKQEKWVDRHVRPEHARLVFTVGALFDFAAAEVQRAPEVVRRWRIEWLYRFLQEPRRLAGRYFIGGPIFIGHVVRAAIAERFAAISRSARPSRQHIVQK